MIFHFRLHMASSLQFSSPFYVVFFIQLIWFELNSNCSEQVYG